MSDLTPRLLAIMTDELNLDVPSTSTDLIESGVLDSMAFVDLLFRIEQEFCVHVELDDLEIENFNTVERIVAFIRRHRKAVARG